VIVARYASALTTASSGCVTAVRPSAAVARTPHGTTIHRGPKTTPPQDIPGAGSRIHHDVAYYRQLADYYIAANDRKVHTGMVTTMDRQIGMFAENHYPR
jgi:hypothetical protein